MSTTKKYVSLDKLTKYDELLKAKIAADDAAALKSAKDYADGLAGNYEAAGSVNTAKTELQGNIDALANGAVAQNTAAIEKLNGDATTEGSVAKAVADSAATLQASIDATDAIADANAADIVTMKSQIAALEAGTYDDTEVRGLISANAEAIEALEGTHGTDKAALEAAIALKADQTALDTVSAVANAAVKQSDYNTKVAALEAEDARIAGLVATETERATGVEEDFETRISAMETFWDATEDSDGIVNKLKEIQDYISGDETGAAEMAGNIQANTQAISAMDTAYKAADAVLQTAIDGKAAAADVEDLEGRVEDLETASASYALKTEVEAVSDALTEYKNAHTSDYTNAQIDAAIKVNTDAIAALGDTYATDDELAAAIESEVTRANGAYAAKSLETAVDEHKADTVSHTTSTEKALWNAALQASDIATGSANGTIAVKGADVAVKGLGSAAYVETTAFDAAGSASAVQTKLDEEVARAKAAEEANAAAIAAFVECSEEDINALFTA